MCPLSWKRRQFHAPELLTVGWYQLFSNRKFNSYITFLHFLKLLQCIILNPSVYLLRRFADVRLVWDQANWWTKSLFNIHPSFAFVQSMHMLSAPTSSNRLPWSLGFKIQRRSLNQQGEDRAYPSAFILALYFCPSTILLGASYG